MLDATLQSQLAAYLERVTLPIEIVASLGDDDNSAEMRDLLQTLQRLRADKIAVRFDGQDARKPSFSLQRAGTDTRLRFAGLPLGHEFTSLVLALLQTGGYPPKLDDALIEQIRNLEGDFEFRTYISLSCQNCPDVVQALNTMAVLNPRIRHTMIDGALFEQEVASLNIRSVPAVYLNGQPFGQGRMSVEEIVAKLDKGAAQRKAAELSQRAPYDVLIVGGGPAGSSAAIYAARKGIRVGVAAERFGGQVLDTLGIENLISVPHTEGPALAVALEENVKAHDVDIMNLQRAEKLVPGELTEVHFAGGAKLAAKTVVIATGARWRELGVPGEKEYRNHGVAYCPHCDGPLFKGREVAVVGGGNSGVEAAIDLAGIVKHVTLVEFMPTLRADAVLVNKLKSLPNVTILTNTETQEVKGNGTEVTAMRCRDRATGESRELPLAGIFVQIGLVPNTDWLKGTLTLSPRGEIEVDARGQTSLPGVFAAGDCTTTPYKQIVIAMGEGSRAALSAFDHLIRTPIAVAA